MNKIILSLLVFFLVAAVPESYAAGHPAEKLARGITNIVFAPVEIPKDMRSKWIEGSEHTYHIIVWLLDGLVVGSVKSLGRLGSGAWDVLTFPVPVPKDYGALMQPECVFADWPQRREGVSYHNPWDRPPQ